MMDNESDPQSGLSTGQPSDAATPDKPERDQRAELGEATVRDLSNLLIALRSLIAGSESRGKSSSRNRNAKAMARGDYIRRTRIAQNMTRYALAAKIGESQQLIARIEYGEVTHSKALPKVLAALGIRPDTQWAETADADGPSSIEGVSSSVPTDVQIEPPEAKMKQNPIQVRLDPDYECFAAELLRIRTKSGAHRAARIQPGAAPHPPAARGAEGGDRKGARAHPQGPPAGLLDLCGRPLLPPRHRSAACASSSSPTRSRRPRTCSRWSSGFTSICAERSPSTGVANASELYFDELDSGYKVGTAGNKGVGRSATLQLLHGSEVAFWPHAADPRRRRAAGGAPSGGHRDHPGDRPPTASATCFTRCGATPRAGAGDYIAIFVPWFWQEEYRTASSGEGFVLDAEEPTTPRSMASMSSRWRGAAARSPSSRTRCCSSRNTRRAPPRHSR